MKYINFKHREKKIKYNLINMNINGLTNDNYDNVKKVSLKRKVC